MSAPMAIRAMRRRVRRGFSLVEVIVAMMIMTGVLLALGGFTAKFAQASSQAHFVINANELAARRLDDARNQPTYSSLDLLAGNDSARSDFMWYKVRTDVLRTGGAVGDTVDYKTVTVTVTHPAMKKVVQKTTIMAAF